MEDGLLLVDKSGGMTSHDVVSRCRRLLQRKDIGHAGTLDPIATGLLVLLVGKATKLSDYILNGNKAYKTKIQLGVVTDTDDISGEVIKENKEFSVTKEQVLEVMEQLTGELELEVPIYSAIKVKGKKLYEKARNGEDFKPPVRVMTFWNVELLDFGGDWLEVSFDCSKGSYVRSWVKTLGNILGCGATVETLRRTLSQPYGVEKSIEFSDLEDKTKEELEESSAWIPLNKTLPDWPSVKIEGMDEKLISNGQIPRKLERYLEVQFAGQKGVKGVKILSRRSGRLISLLSHEPPLSFKIRRVFPNQ